MAYARAVLLFILIEHYNVDEERERETTLLKTLARTGFART